MPGLTPTPKDRRKRYYGPGQPRMIQPGELSINSDEELLQVMIQRNLSQSAFLPLSGGTLSGDVTLSDGVDLIPGSTSGSKIGTSSSQKVAFYGSTPLVQPSSVGQTAGFSAGAGAAVNDDSTFTGGVGTKAYTIGDIVKHLKQLGLIASS